MVTEIGIFVAAVVVVMFCNELEFPSRLTTICVLRVDDGDEGDMSTAMLCASELFDNRVIFRLLECSLFTAVAIVDALFIIRAYDVTDWSSKVN